MLKCVAWIRNKCQVEEMKATATKEREDKSVQLEAVSNDGETRNTKSFTLPKPPPLDQKEAEASRVEISL